MLSIPMEMCSPISVGKFERLDEDWAFVAQKLGITGSYRIEEPIRGRGTTQNITLPNKRRNRKQVQSGHRAVWL